MSTDLTTFPIPTGGELRTVLVDGEPHFIAGDICAALEIAQPASSLRLLDDDEKGVHTVHTLGGPQLVATVNEPGLYSLILRSRKPEAKAFKRWITHEVLPAIRKTGRYGVAPALPTSRQLAELVIAEADRADKAEQALAIAGPKAEVYDTVVANTEGGVKPGDAARTLSNHPLISIGQNKLYARMRAWRWVFRSDGEHHVYQHHLERKPENRLVYQKKRLRPDEDGVRRVPYIQVFLTLRGVAEAQRLLLAEAQGVFDLPPAIAS